MVRGCATFQGTFFMIDSGFMGMVFNNFLHFPDLCMGIVFCKNSLVSCFGISGFMGIIFRKFSRFMGILLRNFS